MSALPSFKTELSGVHLCCRGCTNAADDALRGVAGVDSHCDMEKGSITLTAGDLAAAQKALDALALAGLYGVPADNRLAMNPVNEAPTGKVARVKVSGIHNCCGPCCAAIQRAISNVAGVTGDTARPHAETFEVTGDFLAADLVRAFNKAGFSARIEG